MKKLIACRSRRRPWLRRRHTSGSPERLAANPGVPGTGVRVQDHATGLALR
ncbi:hypothetical protein F8B43_3910 [Methylorubrum populi]|uniref:Uncharacterized protein n=1 Tax=Methylorubrum populi TaxID=223967 RepID=A0A833MW63_9HYPH|nr:hypothetical protein F8B43_3910 [Methylorubrum populi]